MIHQHSSHQLRGDAEEVTSILPIDLPLIEEPQIRLVDDGGDLQTIVSPFAAQAARSEDTQLVMDERHKAIERFSAAAVPRMEQLRDFRRTDRVRHA